MLGAHPEATGGISTVVSNWIESGIEDQIDLTYISTLDDVTPGEHWRKIKNAMKAIKEFLVRTKEPVDIVHIHLSFGMSFYRKLIFFVIARFKQLKTVIHLHGSKFDEFYDKGGWLRKKLISYMFNHADALIALSKEWKSFISSVSNNSNITIVYNGASVEKFANKLDNGDVINILFMGRLGDRKGTYDLIEAFKSLAKSFPEARLLLGGDGELDKVKQILEEEDLIEKVSVLGWVGGDQKIELFRRADMYVLPSYNEGLPGSILEAMAAGSPIVSTTVGGIPEAVLDGINGYLVAPGDITALSQALASLCKDKTLRNRMGKASQELILEKFNINKIVQQIVTLYKVVARVD